MGVNVRPGALRHYITIEQKTVTRDSYGAEVVTWSTFAQAWAGIQPLNGRELIAAQAVQSEITGKIIMRYMTGVKAAMRVSYEGKYYDIKAVIDPLLQHRELQLLISEGLTK